MNNPELDAAYRMTTYVVMRGSMRFGLLIGSRSPQLRKLMHRLGVRSCAFLTAYNPYSVPLGKDQNRRRQRRLAKDLARRGYLTYPGLGQPAKAYRGQWAPEASVLVCGITRRDALRLASRYQQNAIVFCDSKQPPQLVYASVGPLVT